MDLINDNSLSHALCLYEPGPQLYNTILIWAFHPEHEWLPWIWFMVPRGWNLLFYFIIKIYYKICFIIMYQSVKVPRKRNLITKLLQHLFITMLTFVNCFWHLSLMLPWTRMIVTLVITLLFTWHNLVTSVTYRPGTLDLSVVWIWSLLCPVVLQEQPSPVHHGPGEPSGLLASAAAGDGWFHSAGRWQVSHNRGLESPIPNHSSHHWELLLCIHDKYVQIRPTARTVWDIVYVSEHIYIGLFKRRTHTHNIWSILQKTHFYQFNKFNSIIRLHTDGGPVVMFNSFILMHFALSSHCGCILYIWTGFTIKALWN